MYNSYDNEFIHHVHRHNVMILSTKFNLFKGAQKISNYSSIFYLFYVYENNRIELGVKQKL